MIGDGEQNVLRYNVRMNRPKGLVLTAWIMVALLLAGWMRGYLWPHHAQLAHPHPLGHALIVVFLLIVRLTACVCIFYFVRGRNWARIVVLVVSVVSIFGLLQLRHDDTPGKVIGIASALLAMFFLYWLNKRSVREFFKSGGAATIGPV